MRSLLALCALVALAGCDTAADPADLVAYDGVIVVSLVQRDAGPALHLLAEADLNCALPLRVAAGGSPTRLTVRVDGIELPRSGVQCAAIIPASATVALPFTEQGTFPVEVTHAGATDAYRYSVGVAGARLEAVRTSTTRLGP